MESNETLSRMIQFPFLGIKSDGDLFQYLPISVNNNRIKIAIYNWLVNRSILNLGEDVNLLVPFIVDEEFPQEVNLQGKISEIVTDTACQAMIYEVIFPEKVKAVPLENWNLDYHLHNVNFSQDLFQELLINLIKDTRLLKSGVRIYLKHLRAYFSRISIHTRKEYFHLNTLFLADIENHTRDNEKKLEELYDKLRTNLKSFEEIPTMLNLEDLREMIESEISFSLIDLIFAENQTSYRLGIEKLLKPKLGNRCSDYVLAIKGLEKRLYSNYNTIVLIYVKALS